MGLGRQFLKLKGAIMLI